MAKLHNGEYPGRGVAMRYELDEPMRVEPEVAERRALGAMLQGQGDATSVAMVAPPQHSTAAWRTNAGRGA